MHKDNYFPCRRKICMWEHVWSSTKQRILFNEEEHDKKVVKVSKK